MSERKLRANRANAELSTGPKTPEGKRRVARNAVKHGILAREVLIGEGDGAECAEDFAELSAGLYAAHAPRDTAEQVEVENLIAVTWQLRRVYRAMTGDTRTGLDTVRRDWERDRCEHFAALLATAGLDGGVTLRSSSLGCDHLLRLLDAVLTELATGQVSTKTLSPLLEVFPTIAKAPIITRREPPAGEANLLLDDDGRRELAALLLGEREALQRDRAAAERRENAELSAEVARLALPGVGVAERDLRYLTALRKDMARGLSMLTTLKRRDLDLDDTDGTDGQGEAQ